MPWWLLGISNASAIWDITGPMWFVYILYAYLMTTALNSLHHSARLNKLRAQLLLAVIASSV
jgi:hypothetical protein